MESLLKEEEEGRNKRREADLKEGEMMWVCQLG